ncbi:30S ribosomal protein S21 [Candidatus Pacearchaeota archaeon]|nr:30S ribosomal protein S21 [Candidatus Pacearchaeota archaeon]
MSQSKRDKDRKKDFGNTVYVHEGNLEDALRRFNKRIKDAGIMDDLQSKSYFVKPSTVRRKKKLSRKNQ